ncbi:MAG: peptidylprolyl isomerase [Gammaproteobacteria bacterium]
MTRAKIAAAGLLGIAVVVVIVLLQQGGLISLQDLLNPGDTNTAAIDHDGRDVPGEGDSLAATAGEEQEPVGAWGSKGAHVSFESVRNLLANADAGQRRSLLADEEKFRELIRQEARNQSLLAAARANNLHEDGNVRFLMERAADNVLREVYMKRLIGNNLAGDFPSDAQIREYYEKNQDRFRLGERVHIWQVFLPVTEAMDEQQVKSVRERAEAVAADIRSGKTSFASAALEYSGHEPSRNNGGYMGLVNVDELRPGLARPILELEQGEISEPVRTEEGIHIVRKGETVTGRAVALDEVRDQVRDHLRNQAANRIREAIHEKAQETYPVDVDEARIEEWRLRLRTDTPVVKERAADS